MVASVAFHLAYVDRTINLDTVAGFHARGRAGSSADRWEWCTAQQDFQRLVRIIARQGIEEALYIVARRADVIAGRDHLLAVRLLTCPLTRFDDR